MKKSLYLFFAAILSSSTLFGQYIIPKVGVVLSKNNETIDGFHTDAKLGFMAGFAYNTRLSNHLLFQPEIYYIQKSFGFNYTSVGSPATPTTYTNKETYNIGYIEVPVLFRLKLLHEKMYVVFGPSLAVGVGGTYKFDHTTLYDNTPPIHNAGDGSIKFGSRPVSSNNNDKYFDRLFIWGIQPGIGYIFFDKIHVELRGIVSFTNLIATQTSRNQSLVLSASMPLSLHKADIE